MPACFSWKVLPSCPNPGGQSTSQILEEIGQHKVLLTIFDEEDCQKL
jgi:hypothetical protein